MTFPMYLFVREEHSQSCYTLFRLGYFQSDIKWQFVGFLASKCLHFERFPAYPGEYQDSETTLVHHVMFVTSLHHPQFSHC
jgi:hypothetical protein